MSEDKESSPLGQAQTSVAIVGEIVKLAADSPKAKQAADNLGTAAVTLTKTLTVCLLPLAAVNYAYDKARIYFQGRFEEDLQAKTAHIPPERLIEPKASVAGPAIQGLAYVADQPSLRDMYVTLIATAMDAQTQASAHPAFVEIIRQLTAEEALQMKPFLLSNPGIPVVELRETLAGGTSFVTLRTHLVNTVDAETNQPVENRDIITMIDNWCRLGLVQVHYDQFFTGDGVYNWVDARPEYQAAVEAATPPMKVSFERGFVAATSFGRAFADAIGLIPKVIVIDAGTAHME